MSLLIRARVKGFISFCFIGFQKSFDSPPYVLVTAEHSKRSVKHDAATVWVENVLGNIFSVCVRELQNFDGQHKDIKVVSDTAILDYDNTHV